MYFIPDLSDFPPGGRDIQVVPPGPGSGGMHMGHTSKAYHADDIDPQVMHEQHTYCI